VTGGGGGAAAVPPPELAELPVDPPPTWTYRTPLGRAGCLTMIRRVIRRTTTTGRVEPPATAVTGLGSSPSAIAGDANAAIPASHAQARRARLERRRPGVPARSVIAA
jgi:hypothetical protein